MHRLAAAGALPAAIRVPVSAPVTAGALDPQAPDYAISARRCPLLVQVTRLPAAGCSQDSDGTDAPNGWPSAARG
ncbi:hypothetical protein E05_38330 [Plautia stali symbiont]|nr:hypothetical protein E05_38330 [Plautia stali symbiont]